MLHILPLLLFSDNCTLGKFNPSLLSEQQMLELLVAEMHAKKIFQDFRGHFIDYKSWERVRLHKDETVERILWTVGDKWSRLDETCLGGTVNLRWIPHSVLHFSVTDMQLKGTVETSLLPKTLLSFKVSANALRGTFDVSGLPLKMHTVYIHRNNLLGTLDMPSLPASISVFMGHTNSFSGGLDFSNPSPSLNAVYLSHNAFSGPLRLDGIQSMTLMYLDGNRFQQDVLHVGFVVSYAKDNLRIDKAQFGLIVYEDGPEEEVTESQICCAPMSGIRTTFGL